MSTRSNTTRYPNRAQIIDEICARISKGETLRDICRSEGMPNWTTVHDWRREDEGFAQRFARARDLGFDAIAEEAMAIANTPVMGEETEEDHEGRTRRKRADMLGHRKLQIETRLKLLAKWCPSRYGERTAVDVGGGDTPLQVASLTPDQLAATVAAVKAKR